MLKDIIKTNVIKEELLSYTTYTKEILYIILPALLLGLLIDNLFTKLQDDFTIHFSPRIGNIVFGFLQLFFVILGAYIVEKHTNLVNDNYKRVLFTVAYYSVHVNMVNNFSKLLDL